MECKLEVRPSLIVETPSECRRQHVPDKHTLSMHKTQELLKKFYRKILVARQGVFLETGDLYQRPRRSVAACHCVFLETGYLYQGLRKIS